MLFVKKLQGSRYCSCTILSFDTNGRRDIGRQFFGSVLEPFLKSLFNVAVLHASGNLPEEIDRLHTGGIGVANNETPSFRNIPERSSMPGALLSSKCFSILNTLSDSVFENSNLSNHTDCIPKLFGGFGRFNTRFLANEQ